MLYTDLSSFVTITDKNSAELISAYSRYGIIFLSLKIKGKEGSEPFAKIASQYAPQESIMGIYSSPATRMDIGAVAHALINTNGSINAWKIRALENVEEIQFIYAKK